MTQEFETPMAKPSLSHERKTLYEASYREIMAKNFLAGVFHGLGVVLIQLFVFVVLLALIRQYLIPQLGPLFNTVQTAIDQLETLQNSNPFIMPSTETERSTR